MSTVATIFDHTFLSSLIWSSRPYVFSSLLILSIHMLHINVKTPQKCLWHCKIENNLIKCLIILRTFEKLSICLFIFLAFLSTGYLVFLCICFTGFCINFKPSNSINIYNLFYIIIYYVLLRLYGFCSRNKLIRIRLR